MLICAVRRCCSLSLYTIQRTQKPPNYQYVHYKAGHTLIIFFFLFNQRIQLMKKKKKKKQGSISSIHIK